MTDERERGRGGWWTENLDLLLRSGCRASHELQELVRRVLCQVVAEPRVCGSGILHRAEFYIVVSCAALRSSRLRVFPGALRFSGGCTKKGHEWLAVYEGSAVKAGGGGLAGGQCLYPIHQFTSNTLIAA